MQAPNRIRRALRKDLTKGVSTYVSRCKGGFAAGGNRFPADLAGATALTACPSLEGRSGDGWMRKARDGVRTTIQSHDWDAAPCPALPDFPCALQLS